MELLVYRWCKSCKHTIPRNSQDARSMVNHNSALSSPIALRIGPLRPFSEPVLNSQISDHILVLVSSPTWHRATSSGQPCPSGQSHHRWPWRALQLSHQYSQCPIPFVPLRRKLRSPHKHPPIPHKPSTLQASPSSHPLRSATMPSPSRPAPSPPLDAWNAP